MWGGGGCGWGGPMAAGCMGGWLLGTLHPFVCRVARCPLRHWQLLLLLLLLLLWWWWWCRYGSTPASGVHVGDHVLVRKDTQAARGVVVEVDAATGSEVRARTEPRTTILAHSCFGTEQPPPPPPPLAPTSAFHTHPAALNHPGKPPPRPRPRPLACAVVPSEPARVCHQKGVGRIADPGPRSWVQLLVQFTMHRQVRSIGRQLCGQW